MTMADLLKKSDADLDALYNALLLRGNNRACTAIQNIQKYYGKQVIVVRGRKVPKGTTGECFWLGERNYSKAPDPDGLCSKYRAGIRDDAGNVYWTDLSNVELA